MKFNEITEEKFDMSWHDSKAPKAEGRFTDLSVEDLAKWLIRTRNKDFQRINGALTQQIVFNQKNPDRKEYVEKMEKTREAVKKQLGIEDDK